MTQLKFIFRKLWRDRFFTFLKVLGLSIGIATCLVVFKIVYYEFNFDKKIPDRENIYQVVQHSTYDGKESKFGGVQMVLADYVMENLSDIERIIPLNNDNFSFVQVEKDHSVIYREEDPKVHITTSSYFEMLPYQWLAGNPKTALSEPYQVVLTQSKAEKYFGKIAADAILGSTINYGDELYTVSGVVKDLDFPSSFVAKEFVSLQAEENAQDWQWLSFNSNFNLFVQLNPAQKEGFLNQIDQKVNEMIEANNLDLAVQYRLLPLSEKHFAEEYGTFAYTANKKILFGLIGIGLFILLLAAINYINLSTAQIPYRTKEIGVRKTLGARGNGLTSAFLYETFIIVLAGALLAFPLLWGFEQRFIEFMPRDIEAYSLLLPKLIFVLALSISITFLTSLYPAYLINKINVSEILKIQSAGKLSLGNLNIRKVLIVFQFVIAQVFVIGAFIIASQINYMINAELGFEKDAIVTLRLPYKSYHNADTDPFLLKQALHKYPEIQAVALGHTPMNNMHWGNTLYLKSGSDLKELNMNFKYVDTEYMDLFEIEVVAGRTPQMRDTTGSVFMNETARARLGFETNEEAIGVQVKGSSDQALEIVGIVNDFHQRDLNASKAPVGLMISNNKDRLWGFNIKLPEAPSEWETALAIVETEWKNFYPDAPFKYDFYDAEIKQLYESDMRQSKMINLATIITIVLGCLGLIGLVTLTAYQRTKEIGIRKVLGSSVSDVVILLSKDYLKLIGWAILISIPIAWWAMNKWLDDFAYRIEIKWWMFLVTGFATVLMALLAVSFRAIKAAMANPVESLRDE